MSVKEFDIAVIGGGHAGLEAAWIASQFDLKVAIFTLPETPIASTPCNPAIGGVGKGQVVREIDALGGAMGKIADLSAIQYRILNESKGYAVRSTRVQVDKDLYSQNAQILVEANPRIDVVRGRVEKIFFRDDLFHVELSGSTYFSQKLVLTTGTFLGGLLHCGEAQVDGGRVNCPSSASLSNLFSGVAKLPQRFKTGTPPRLDRNSLDFSFFEEQESDPRAANFHFAHDANKRNVRQISCYLTRTTEKTLSIIRDNREKSPLFNGQIKGVGPRYCPSIEDKAFRYPDRNSHHVFIEPEGLETNSIYPNGISTSLPKEIQESFLRTIPGLEKAKIIVPGYAVEYDVVDTSKLDLTLQYIDIPGLYFAGQVNGTSGYEEAAGQGIIAGANAALSLLGRESLILDRDHSYIGVMIEDLVSNKRDEPYRLFTARAENRLYIREDNTFLRMYPYRKLLGLEEEIDRFMDELMAEYEILSSLCEKTRYMFHVEQEYFAEKEYGPIDQNISLSELLRRSKLDPVIVLEQECARFGSSFRKEVIAAVAISKKYEGYIDKAKTENEKHHRLSKRNIDWKKICRSQNISNECRQRIESVRPETFGQLQRMDGIRPATLAYVVGKFLS